MPPRGRKKKQLKEWWRGGDTPEVKTLGAGLRALRLHNAGYLEGQDEANKITARYLAAPAGVKNAKTAFMLPVPGRKGGDFLIGATAPEVIKKLGILNTSLLNREFNKGKLTEDAKMPGFRRSIIDGFPVMRSYHYPAVDPDEQAVFDLVGHGALD